jgi:WD40 repeat protein
VWSIVEADELGQVSIFKISRGVSTVSSLDSEEALPLGEKLFTRTLPEKVNCFKMSREGRIFLGMANGNIDVYDIQNPGVRALSIAAHGNSPVIGLELLSDDTVVSVSLDSTLRISSASTGQLIGGGKLTRRMIDKEIFRSFHLHAPSGRTFLGTSQGRLFVIDVSSGSPNFLHVGTVNTYPIRCISSFGDSFLLVGCGPYLYHFGLPNKGEDPKLERKMSIQTADGSNVHACLSLSEDIVAAGLGDGSVTIYNGVVPVYSRLFTFEKVNHLLYSDHVLWAGGDDGRIVEVIIPPTLNEDASYAASFVVPEEVEPKPISVERKIQDSPKVVNPSCLKKSSALAEDDSDDDWKRNLFAN